MADLPVRDPETGKRLLLSAYGRACYRAGEAKADKTAQSCATCQHYSGESCADTRPHPMQHKLCPPTWGCPMWEKAENA